MCMLQFLNAGFGGSSAREADKISNFFKKIMFIGYVPMCHMAEEHSSSTPMSM
jgi:hypothetical protein